MIKAVFFDIGETLVDETRQWFEWADWLGVPRLTFSCALGATIQQGEHHRRVFEVFDPAFDYEAAKAARARAGNEYIIGPEDIYPDAIPVLTRLRSAGYMIGIAGNQPVEAENALKKCGIIADKIASSAAWGVEKPSVAFFNRIIECADFEPSEIAYVGDRLDNDVIPARLCGMCSVFLVRGPWAVIQSKSLDTSKASLVVNSLYDLPEALRQF